MSYNRMDHAGWVQNQIDATRSRPERRTKQVAARKREGKGWESAPERLSEFQARVMDVLGIVGGGIYNAPVCWDAVVWNYGWNGVMVPWERPDLATFDFNQLTMLVFLCHEARIRCSVDSHGPRRLRLCFWQRKHKGGLAERHPNLDEAVAAFREYLPADHRIIYRAPVEAEAATA